MTIIQLINNHFVIKLFCTCILSLCFYFVALLAGIAAWIKKSVQCHSCESRNPP
ncbi:MAG TPA: hypothetical protein LFV92_05110 [Rickettsia endosymbiont of Ceroptres masudai]|nr:hypothetical protein [Rickettsia endosymbiont of Ceroptres masudai]